MRTIPVATSIVMDEVSLCLEPRRQPPCGRTEAYKRPALEPKPIQLDAPDPASPLRLDKPRFTKFSRFPDLLPPAPPIRRGKRVVDAIVADAASRGGGRQQTLGTRAAEC